MGVRVIHGKKDGYRLCRPLLLHDSVGIWSSVR